MEKHNRRLFILSSAFVISDCHSAVHVFGEPRINCSDSAGGCKNEPATDGQHSAASLTCKIFSVLNTRERL